jgi:hypothetical protein
MPALVGTVHRLHNKKWGEAFFCLPPAGGQDLVRAALASRLRGAREARLFVQPIKAPPYFQR